MDLFKKRLYLALPLIIVLFAAFLRLIWISMVPPAIGGDELDYVLNSKAFYLTGKDLLGKITPLSLFSFNYPKGEFPKAELPYLLYMPLIGPTDFSLFTARLTNVIFSTLSVLFIYLIAKKLLGKNIALLAAFIGAINPWFIYIGRTAYDMVPAVFFYLCGFYFLISAKRNRILLTIPFLFLGFYSYIGTKLIIIPLALAAGLWGYLAQNRRNFLRQYFIVFLSSLLLVGFFAFSLSTNPSSSRLSEISGPNALQLAKQTDDIRMVSVQTPLTNLFENKTTIFSKILVDKFFNVFSVNYLFLHGDEFFSLYDHGLFYWLDALFLLLGIIFIYKKSRRLLFFIILVIIIGVLPQLAHINSRSNFTPHVSLIFPFLILFIASGIWELINLFKKPAAILAAILIIFFYLFSLLNFINIYFFQYPVRGRFDFPLRLVSKYATLAGKNSAPVTIYSTRSPDVFRKYIFYTNAFKRGTEKTIKNAILNNRYQWQNIKFTSCDNFLDPKKIKGVAIYDSECGNLEKDYAYASVLNLYDRGGVYRIYNEEVCRKYNKKLPVKITDFDIENLVIERFCGVYIL